MNSNYSRGQLEDATVSSTRKKGSPALDVLGLLKRENTLAASEADVMELLSTEPQLLDNEAKMYDIHSVPFDPATIAAVREYFALGVDEISDYRLLANLVSMHKAHEAHTTYQADAQDSARERRDLEEQRYWIKAQKAYEQVMWKRAEEARAFDELERRKQAEYKRQEFEQGSSKGKGRTRR